LSAASPSDVIVGDLERRALISTRRRKIAIRDPEKLAKEIRV